MRSEAWLCSAWRVISDGILKGDHRTASNASDYKDYWSGVCDGIKYALGRSVTLPIEKDTIKQHFDRRRRRID